jgi:hypothetical protein
MGILAGKIKTSCKKLRFFVRKILCFELKYFTMLNNESNLSIIGGKDYVIC